jgi:hypothetical protein
MAENVDKSGFDYYLDLLQESRDQTLKEAPRRIFRLLQVHGGQMQLYELVSESLPKDAGEGEVDYIVETIKSLQEAELIVVETLQENDEQVVKSSETMIVRVTETGRKVLYSGFAT